MAEAASRWLDRWLAWRRPAAVLAIALAALCVGPAFRVPFNRSIEQMFAPDDPLLGPYEVLKRSFGGNEIVLGVYRDPDLLAPDGTGVRRLASVGARLRDVPGVREVLTLDRPIGETIVDPRSRTAAALREVFVGYTHSADGRTAAAVCMLDPQAEGAVRTAAIGRIREVLESLPDGLPPGLIAGEPVMVEEGFRQLEGDGRRLAIWSTLLLGLALAVSFRNLRWVILPLAIVQFALLTTRALLLATGVRLTMVSSMLAAILTVVGIATTVHVAVQYRNRREAGDAPFTALRSSLLVLVAPIVWSCVTDAIGFGSLMSSEVGPVRDFGLMTAVGSIAVLLGIGLIVPFGALVGARRADPHDGGEGRRDSWLERRLRSMPERLLRHRRWATFLLLATAGAGLSGLGRLDVETDFTRNFRAGSPLVRSYETIEAEFGGAGVLDVVLPAPESFTHDYLQRVLRLERRLRDEVRVRDERGGDSPGLTKVLSPADAIAATTPEGLPGPARDLAVRLAWDGMRRTIPAFAEALHARHYRDPDRWLLRIMLRAKERQPAEAKLQLIEQVRAIVADELDRPDWSAWRSAARSAPRSPESRASGDDPAADPGDGAEVERGLVTGYFVLLTQLIRSVVQDQWTSFGIASAGVACCLLAALRDLRLASIALIPNALPVVAVLGALGWCDVKMNLGAAMIAAVSMGLTVDGSLHYLIDYRRRRAAGAGAAAALESAQAEIGRAMVLSTLALVVGFSVLCTSPFVPTVTFGWLMSVAMLGGLVGNLGVLPLLVLLTERARPA